MPHHRYLIVGGGMTADAAVRGIRSEDDEGSIGIVGEEEAPPYDRPPLSKGLWKGSDEDGIWRETAEMDVELHLGRRVERIDPADRTVTDDRGVIYTWERLLLATGGRPRRLDDAVARVLYFRTLDDYRRLRDQTRDGDRFAVVGGSFIGSEVAAALAGTGKQVTLVFPEEGICRGVFPPHVAERLNDHFRAEGVDVRPGVGVASVRRGRGGLLVATAEESTETLEVDGVVAGIGIVPNQELAATAGLEVVEVEDGGGIVVDASLRTSAEDVWAAGDVASVWTPALGERRRVEHEDQANTTGMLAGRAMAGADVQYDHLPFFYSELFGLSYEAVGELDPDLEVVESWADDVLAGPGVLYYRAGGRVRGVALWNVRGKLREARRLIRSGERLTEGGLENAIDLG